jgi:hypothetical protein
MYGDILQGSLRLRPIRDVQPLLARRGLGSPLACASGTSEPRYSEAAELTTPALCKLRLCAWQRYLDSIRRACDLGVGGGDGGTQALRDHFRVMLESSLRILCAGARSIQQVPRGARVQKHLPMPRMSAAFTPKRHYSIIGPYLNHHVPLATSFLSMEMVENQSTVPA